MGGYQGIGLIMKIVMLSNHATIMKLNSQTPPAERVA
jgi:hypothetical protein